MLWFYQMQCFRYVIFLIFFPYFLYALSLQEIISFALQNNYQLEAKQQFLKNAKMNERAAYSLFMPNLEVGYTYNYRAPQNRAAFSSNTMNITGQINLFNGLRDFYMLKKNKLEIRTQENNLAMSKNDIVLQTKVAYIKILENKEALKIASDSIKLLETQLNQSQQFYIHGINDKSAVLNMEVKLANARIEYNKVQIDLEHNLNILQKLSGMELNAESLDSINVQEDIAFNKKELLEEIYARNLQIKNFQFLMQDYVLDKKIAQGQHYPKIQASASKYWYLTGENTALINSSLQSQVRIDVVWNLFDNYNAYFNAEAKQANILAINAQILDLRKDIETEVNYLFNSFEVSKQQLNLAKIALIQAEENYRIVSNRYQQNIANYIELLNAELLLTDAKSSIVQARYQMALNIAYIQHFKNEQIGE